MVAVSEAKTIVGNGVTGIVMSVDDFAVDVYGHLHWASDDLDRFCQLLTSYWPVPTAESYRFMLRRLIGAKCLYSDTCDGQTAVPTGKPVNIFGVVVTDNYAPLDDWDNMMDVVTVIQKVYG